jgi:hypothetical protein
MVSEFAADHYDQHPLPRLQFARADGVNELSAISWDL